jgi:hypothetical protein
LSSSHKCRDKLRRRKKRRGGRKRKRRRRQEEEEEEEEEETTQNRCPPFLSFLSPSNPRSDYFLLTS